MFDKIPIEDAEMILGDVKPAQCFWVNNGPIIHNLHEMSDTLNYMKDEVFKHHVNEEKNDIANWVRDVLKDNKLADSIKRIMRKDRVLDRINERIKQLEKRIEEARAY